MSVLKSSITYPKGSTPQGILILITYIGMYSIILLILPQLNKMCALSYLVTIISTRTGFSEQITKDSFY